MHKEPLRFCVFAVQKLPGLVPFVGFVATLRGTRQETEDRRDKRVSAPSAFSAVKKPGTICNQVICNLKRR
jgi:hypothetical protein